MLGACSFIRQRGGRGRLSSDAQRQPGPEKVKATACRPRLWWRPWSSPHLQASVELPPGPLGSALFLPWLAFPRVSALRTFQLNFARAELKVTSRQFQFKKERKEREKEKGGGQPERAFCNYPLKLEYASRCFYFHPVLLSFQSGEMSSKVIIRLITLIV